MQKYPPFQIVALVAFLFAQASCEEEPIPETLLVSSPAFGAGQVIPQSHTCFGAGDSPALFISNPPEETQMFALLLESIIPDRETETLWLLWGIPGDTGAVPHGVPPGSYDVFPLRQGRADNKKVGYQPPCAPQGVYGQFRFKAFALDMTEIPQMDYAVDRADFDRLIRGHILATGALTGIFRGR